MIGRKYGRGNQPLSDYASIYKQVVDQADGSPIRFLRELRIQVASPRRYSLLDTRTPSCIQHLASEMLLTHRFTEAQVNSSGSLTATNNCHVTQCCSWHSSSVDRRKRTRVNGTSYLDVAAGGVEQHDGYQPS